MIYFLQWTIEEEEEKEGIKGIKVAIVFSILFSLYYILEVCTGNVRFPYCGIFIPILLNCTCFTF